jgi:hypothetical protein
MSDVDVKGPQPGRGRFRTADICFVSLVAATYQSSMVNDGEQGRAFV